MRALCLMRRHLSEKKNRTQSLEELKIDPPDLLTHSQESKCDTHLEVGKSEREDICLGTLLAVGACILTEEYHVILSASGNYALGFCS